MPVSINGGNVTIKGKAIFAILGGLLIIFFSMQYFRNSFEDSTTIDNKLKIEENESVNENETSPSKVPSGSHQKKDDLNERKKRIKEKINPSNKQPNYISPDEQNKNLEKIDTTKNGKIDFG